ncbi:MAG: sigma-54-dependent Fis family transcriptional regulator [Proteobacteria bacterium]|nr:sigma-54-dependent Fis family transcriptional regulator [Pseudomonadota bacterium]
MHSRGKNKRAEDTSILVVDDEPITLKTLQRILEKEGYGTTATANGEQALDEISRHSFDVILTDLAMEPVDGLTVLTEAKAINPETEVIIITGYASVETAIEATKRGAFHYLQKPVRPDDVRHVVRQALEKKGLRSRIRDLEQQVTADFPTIIGHSPKIKDLKKLIQRIANTDSNVVVTGESGTGKELVARAIHESSRRKESRFLAFNCASFADELLANELFGHEKDAFTGATSTRAGLLESATGGTVFFDEVGDMPATMQAKLLRVLQEKELIRVGGTTPVSVDIRIIASTNKDLKKLSDHGLFRQDLFFRLGVISIRLPNLSERSKDIPLLAGHFLMKYGGQSNRKMTGFSDEAIGLLTTYGYPGNVRELENIVERAVSFARGDQIEMEDLPPDLKDFDSFTFHSSKEKLKTLEEVEWEYIQWVLEKTGNNKSEAAQILGINRVSLYRKLKKFAFED